MASSDDTQLIIEHFDDKFAALLESIDSMIESKLQPVATDVSELTNDIKTIKTAVQDTNHDILDIDNRLSRLESAL